MSTILNNFFAINGVIDTSKSVMSNMKTLAGAASCWVTFDIQNGQWSVVVNEPEVSVASFDDNNIIGSISVSGTGISDLYNKVELQYPNKDLNDGTDIVVYEIPLADRYPFESENVLSLQYDIINNSAQAKYIAALQLKQSRTDKIINFKTDYSRLGIRAGDVIDVTNSIYGFNAKKFRILTVGEEDADDNTIIVNITAFEYDINVYDDSGLTVADRIAQNGITTNCTNQAIAESNDSAMTDTITRLIIPLAATTLFKAMFGETADKKYMDALTKKSTALSVSQTRICEGEGTIMTVTTCTAGCADLSKLTVKYTITGVTADDIGVPLTGTIPLAANGIGTLAITPNADSFPEGIETMTFTINDGAEDQSVEVEITDSYNYELVPVKSSIPEGQSTIVTVHVTGMSGTVNKPWNITGDTDVLTSPSSGTVNIVDGYGTIDIFTKDQDLLVDKSLTVNFDPDTHYCSGAPVSIAVTHTGTLPPDPPPLTNCSYVSIPLQWCASVSIDGNTLNRVDPVQYIHAFAAIDGQPYITVPTAITVASNVMTVSATVNIDASLNAGGIPAEVITTFDAWEVGKKRITGTVTAFRGAL